MQTAAVKPGKMRAAARNPIFTLIELLVVISIIMILMSILLPSLGRAREAAKLMQCISNHKQIAIAVASYTSDFDGKLFDPLKTGGSYSSLNNWGGYPFPTATSGTNTIAPKDRPISPYLTSKYVYVCPNDDLRGAISTNATPRYPSMGTSYYCNGYTLGSDTSCPPRTGAMNQIVRPSKIPLIFDMPVWYTGIPSWPCHSTPMTWHDKSIRRMSPTSFFDGHVKNTNFSRGNYYWSLGAEGDYAWVNKYATQL